jgi:hypothetical protein
MPEGREGPVSQEKVGRFLVLGAAFQTGFHGNRTATAQGIGRERPLDLVKKGVYSSNT